MRKMQKRKWRVPVIILHPHPNGGVSGETFNSIAEASRRTGVKKQDIKAACKSIRATAGGYRWTFAYDQDELNRIDAMVKDVSETGVSVKNL